MHALRALVLSTALLGACASDPRTPFTESEEMTAVPIGGPNIRYWADATASTLQGAVRRAVVQKGRPFVYLALSRGGGGGAFGAGVPNGWTEFCFARSSFLVAYFPKLRPQEKTIAQHGLPASGAPIVERFLARRQTPANRNGYGAASHSLD